MPYLDALVSNQDVPHSKPAPDIYLKAASTLGVPPAECLVVEDNPNGIAAARAAGCPLLIVQEVTDVTYERVVDAIAHPPP